MTIHFSQFDDIPPALDEAVLSPAEKVRRGILKDLTGSKINRAIQAECDDPDCPNSKKKDSLTSGIFQTDSRLRCVL